MHDIECNLPLRNLYRENVWCKCDVCDRTTISWLSTSRSLNGSNVLYVHINYKPRMLPPTHHNLTLYIYMDHIRSTSNCVVYHNQLRAWLINQWHTNFICSRYTGEPRQTRKGWNRSFRASARGGQTGSRHATAPPNRTCPNPPCQCQCQVPSLPPPRAHLPNPPFRYQLTLRTHLTKPISSRPHHARAVLTLPITPSRSGRFTQTPCSNKGLAPCVHTCSAKGHREHNYASCEGPLCESL